MSVIVSLLRGLRQADATKQEEPEVCDDALPQKILTAHYNFILSLCSQVSAGAYESQKTTLTVIYQIANPCFCFCCLVV